MEKKGQDNKGKAKGQASPFQELYGKKQGDGKPKGAGEFGSAAKVPGPESSAPSGTGSDDGDGKQA